MYLKPESQFHQHVGKRHMLLIKLCAVALLHSTDNVIINDMMVGHSASLHCEIFCHVHKLSMDLTEEAC